MKKYIIAITLCLIAVYSCKDDDYLIDGGTSTQFLGVSTYDYLSSNPLFDTLVIAINKAGLKAALDGEVTLFATTHFSFRNYINLMTIRGRKINNDPEYVYKFDSIPTQILHDSLSMYIFPGKIAREDMTKEGAVTPSINDRKLRISLEPRNDYPTHLTEKPQYVFLTEKRGDNWDIWDAKNLLPAEIDLKERIQTSNLISTTGVIHVMPGGHTLFFDRD